MQILSKEEIAQVSGALHMNIGTFLVSVAVGFVTMGPAGVGIALCAAVANEGINKTSGMLDQELKERIRDKFR